MAALFLDKLVLSRMLLLKRMNWCMLAIQSIALPFLTLGLQQLQLIRWVSFIQAYNRHGFEGIRQVLPPEMSGAELITGIVVGPHYAAASALLMGCLFSTLVVWRRQESKLLPLLLLGVAILLSRTGYARSTVVLKILAGLRWPFEQWPVEVRLGLVGCTLVGVGTGLFWLTWKRYSYSSKPTT